MLIELYGNLTKGERSNSKINIEINIKTLKTLFCSSLQRELLQSNNRRSRHFNSLDLCVYIENYGKSTGELKAIEQKIEEDIIYIENGLKSKKPRLKLISFNFDFRGMHYLYFERFKIYCLEPEFVIEGDVPNAI